MAVQQAALAPAMQARLAAAKQEGQLQAVLQRHTLALQATEKEEWLAMARMGPPMLVLQQAPLQPAKMLRTATAVQPKL